MIKPRILLVDEEAPMRDILSLYFRGKGIEVTTAATGQQARDLSHQSAFDLAILDLNLANDDGLGILEFLKGKWPDRPVIIFTNGTMDEGFLKKTLAGRADGFMRKMSSLADLLAEALRLLPKHQTGLGVLGVP